MERLSRQLIKEGGISKQVSVGTLAVLPEKIVQFGEGNFSACI